MKFKPMIIRKTAFLFSAFLIFLLNVSVNAQQNKEEVILSGVVIESAVSDPIPNVTIKNISRNTSTLADSTGFFSLAGMPGDTLLFEAMLYKTDYYVVPEGIGGSHFAVIETMEKDAVVLDEVTIRAFPTQQQFERALLEIDPGNMADKTLRLNAHVEEVTEDPTNMQQYLSTYNRKHIQRQITYRIPGLAPGNNFLNPERWRQFINDWQDGRFDEESIEKLEGFPAQETDDQIQEGIVD